MRKFLARRTLKAFADHYHYDVSYMDHMLTVSPAAMFKFAKLTQLSQHREAAPVEATFAAKLVGALLEDCGPCVQLVVDMAAEAGVPLASTEAVLTRDAKSMDENTQVAFRFADALAHRSLELDEAREAVRLRWGDAGVIDLTLSMQIGRVYPMVKVGLGFGKTCQRVQVGDHPVDVMKEAA